MGRLVNTYKTNPIIFELARHLVKDCKQKDYVCEAKKILHYVQHCIRYCRDVYNVETLQIPTYTLKNKTGDCDDKTVLFCALMESIGHPCKFVVVGNGGKFQHVYAKTKVGRSWFACELTEPWPLGKLYGKKPDTKKEFFYQKCKTL